MEENGLLFSTADERKSAAKNSEGKCFLFRRSRPWMHSFVAWSRYTGAVTDTEQDIGATGAE